MCGHPVNLRGMRRKLVTGGGGGNNVEVHLRTDVMLRSWTFTCSCACRCDATLLGDRKMFSKLLEMMEETMVSCWFSLKPIHWSDYFHSCLKASGASTTGMALGWESSLDFNQKCPRNSWQTSDPEVLCTHIYIDICIYNIHNFNIYIYM